VIQNGTNERLEEEQGGSLGELLTWVSSTVSTCKSAQDTEGSESENEGSGEKSGVHRRGYFRSVKEEARGKG
jgi:hypothetical protein